MAIVTFVIAAISMGVAIYSAFRAGGLRERGKWYHRAHEAMARDGKSLRSLSSDPGTVTLRIEDVVADTSQIIEPCEVIIVLNKTFKSVKCISKTLLGFMMMT